jgi:hypothetical protein
MRLNHVDDIFFAVCAASNISKWELLQYNRENIYCDFRHIAAFLIAEANPEASLRDVAQYFEGRNYSTISNSINLVKDTLHVNSLITKRYYQTLKILRPMTTEEKILDLKNQQKTLKQRINATFNYASPSFKQAQSDMIRITKEIEELENELIQNNNQ